MTKLERLSLFFTVDTIRFPALAALAGVTSVALDLANGAAITGGSEVIVRRFEQGRTAILAVAAC